MSIEPVRVPGWYDDEADAASLRYWDGRGWTPHTAAKPHGHEDIGDLFALFADSAVPEHTAVLEHTTVLEQTTEPLAPAPHARRTPRRPWRVGGRR